MTVAGPDPSPSVSEKVDRAKVFAVLRHELVKAENAGAGHITFGELTDKECSLAYDTLEHFLDVLWVRAKKEID